MPNTITIELCKEDRERLDAIVEMLGGIYLSVKNAGTPFDAPVESQKEKPVAVPTPEPEMPVAAKEPAKAEPEMRVVPLSDIQQKVVALSAAGKKAEVREIVKAYADRVSAIPEDKTAEVWDKLTALEG